MDKGTRPFCDLFTLGLKVLWGTGGPKVEKKPRLSCPGPADSSLSSGRNRQGGRQRFAWRTTRRAPPHPHLVPVFFSAVRQGVRLQHPPHVWQRGQADGLHPLQLHEGDPVQPAQPRRLPRWVRPPWSSNICLIWTIWCYELVVTSSYYHFTLVFLSRMSVSTQWPWAAKAEAAGLQSGSKRNHSGGCRPCRRALTCSVSYAPTVSCHRIDEKKKQNEQNTSVGLSCGWKRSLARAEVSVAGFLPRLEYRALG